MKITVLCAAASLGVAALVPGIASATFVLDTGTPTGPSVVLNSSGWYAEEFSVPAGTSAITQLSVYLTEDIGQPGNTFTWDLYSAAGTFLGPNREAPTLTTTGTFLANGWNSVSVNWAPSAGNYWIALQVTGSGQTPGLDLPTETASSNGTVPAIAYASMTSGNRYATTANEVGIQVSAVPLPGALWLLGSGLLAFGTWARRGRARPSNPEAVRVMQISQSTAPLPVLPIFRQTAAAEGSRERYHAPGVQPECRAGSTRPPLR